METKNSKRIKKSADNSTCLQSDGLIINTVKLQGNESFLVAQLQEKFLPYSHKKNLPKHITEEYFACSGVLLIQHDKIKHKKINTKIQHETI